MAHDRARARGSCVAARLQLSLSSERNCDHRASRQGKRVANLGEGEAARGSVPFPSEVCVRSPTRRYSGRKRVCELRQVTARDGTVQGSPTTARGLPSWGEGRLVNPAARRRRRRVCTLRTTPACENSGPLSRNVRSFRLRCEEATSWSSEKEQSVPGGRHWGESPLLDRGTNNLDSGFSINDDEKCVVPKLSFVILNP